MTRGKEGERKGKNRNKDEKEDEDHIIFSRILEVL